MASIYDGVGLPYHHEDDTCGTLLRNRQWSYKAGETQILQESQIATYLGHATWIHVLHTQETMSAPREKVFLNVSPTWKDAKANAFSSRIWFVIEVFLPNTILFVWGGDWISGTPYIFVEQMNELKNKLHELKTGISMLKFGQYSSI